MTSIKWSNRNGSRDWFRELLWRYHFAPKARKELEIHEDGPWGNNEFLSGTWLGRFVSNNSFLQFSFNHLTVGYYVQILLDRCDMFKLIRNILALMNLSSMCTFIVCKKMTVTRLSNKQRQSSVWCREYYAQETSRKKQTDRYRWNFRSFKPGG